MTELLCTSAMGEACHVCLAVTQMAAKEFKNVQNIEGARYFVHIRAAEMSSWF